MEFPIGIAANVAAVILGGLAGAAVKKYLPARVVEMLYMSFGFCALCIGVVSVVKLHSLTVVILSVLFGGVIGELCHIDSGVQRLIRFTMTKIGRGGEDTPQEQTELLCLAMALICFSGTGIFGALSEGLDADHSILLAKAVLDLFTVMVIATQTGWFVTLFSIPQLVIFTLCFFCASLIAPVLTPETVGNFKATGGILTFMVGYNMLAGQVGLKKIRVLNAVPALILSIFFSWAAGFLPFAI
ncbi:MAG: DUF554 domain-containing protein [Ruminococcus sp.]|uniref:DUF554 domain-containing protein n=1 Tax=Ruminococcus sp. TaxID=41978 RepID=UPI002873E4DB|nr:DUF554 domain-containing protein [Ruminococcus sp.]MBQ3284181.1 DUF554 domain-containing protein [Ruminococcus sp.]